MKNQIFTMGIENSDIKIFHDTKKKKTPFEIVLNGKIIAKTDAEDKARMYVDAFHEGYYTSHFNKA